MRIAFGGKKLIVSGDEFSFARRDFPKQRTVDDGSDCINDPIVVLGGPFEDLFDFPVVFRFFAIGVGEQLDLGRPDADLRLEFL